MLVVEVVMQMHGNPWGLSFSTWCVSVVVHLNWKVSGYKDLWKKFSKNFTSYTNNCEVDTTHEMVMLCFQMLKKNSIRCNLYFWNLVVIVFFFHFSSDFSGQCHFLLSNGNIVKIILLLAIVDLMIYFKVYMSYEVI